MKSEPTTLPTLPRPLATRTPWPTFLLTQEERLTVARGGLPQVTLTVTNGVIFVSPSPKPVLPPMKAKTVSGVKSRTVEPSKEAGHRSSTPLQSPKRKYPPDREESFPASSPSATTPAPKGGLSARRVYPPHEALEE